MIPLWAEVWKIIVWDFVDCLAEVAWCSKDVSGVSVAVALGGTRESRHILLSVVSVFMVLPSLKHI